MIEHETRIHVEVDQSILFLKVNIKLFDFEKFCQCHVNRVIDELTCLFSPRVDDHYVLQQVVDVLVNHECYEIFL